jgi:hypothetical protein
MQLERLAQDTAVSWFSAPAGEPGMETADHFEPFQLSARVTKVFDALLSWPTAMHLEMLGQLTATKLLFGCVAVDGSSVLTITQLEPFQRSARVYISTP